MIPRTRPLRKSLAKALSADAPQSEPAVEEPAHASRYSVPCAECGTLLPARGPKAVAAYCRDDAKRKAARERRRIEERRKAD